MWEQVRDARRKAECGGKTYWLQSRGYKAQGSVAASGSWGENLANQQARDMSVVNVVTPGAQNGRAAPLLPPLPAAAAPLHCCGQQAVAAAGAAAAAAAALLARRVGC